MRRDLSRRPRRAHSPHPKGVEPQPSPQGEGSPLDKKFSTFRRNKN